MSASREKKQRQQSGPSEKVSQAQLEQAAYRKKVRLYTVIGVVIAVLVAALLIWNSGIFQSRAAAATVGSEKITTAQLGYYYYDTRYVYAQYGMLDSSKSDADQKYSEEQTWQDYLLEAALTSAQKDLAVYQEAVKAGYSASDADIQSQLSSAVENLKTSAAANNYSYKSFLKAVYGRYMTPSVFEEVYTRALVASKYYNDIYEEHLASYDDKALEDYYAEHADDVDTFTYSYLYFKADSVSTKDADGNELSEEEIAKLKEEAMAAAKAKAAEALELYENGTELSALIEEKEPTSSRDHYESTGVSSISTVFSEQLLKLAADEAAVVEYENNGYYVVVYHGRERNEERSAAIRSIFLSIELAEDAEKPTVQDWADAEKKANELLEQWKNGEKTEDSFAALADSNGMNNGGLFTGFTSKTSADEDGRVDWLFGDKEPAVGDTAVTRYEYGNYDAYGLYVSYFQEWEETIWKQNVRSTLAGEHFEQWMEQLLTGYEAQLSSGAYSLGK